MHQFFVQVRNLSDLNNAVNIKLLEQVLKTCSAIDTFEVRQTIFRNGLRNFCPESLRLRKLRVKSSKYLEIVDHRLEELSGLHDLQLQGVKLYNDRALINVFLNNEETLTVLKLDVWKHPFNGE